MPSVDSTDGYAEVALSTDSEPQGCPSEDTEFSSDEHSSAVEFTSRMGYYGGYKSLSLADRAYVVRPLFYLPPGANSDALIRRVVDDALQMSRDGVTVYDAFRRENAVVRVYLCLSVFDFPMAATFSNSVGLEVLSTAQAATLCIQSLHQRGESAR